MPDHLNGNSEVQVCVLLFFFNDTATTEIYTLSLHDALPIYDEVARAQDARQLPSQGLGIRRRRQDVLAPHASVPATADRKSTRLNSSHANISYAVFCLKKNKQPGEMKAKSPPRASIRAGPCT